MFNTHAETQLHTHRNASEHKMLTNLTRKEGNVLFNYTFNTFYLLLYGIRYVVKDDSQYEKKPAAATWPTLSD